MKKRTILAIGVLIIILLAGAVYFWTRSEKYCHGAMTPDGTVAGHCHTWEEYFREDGLIHVH